MIHSQTSLCRNQEDSTGTKKKRIFIFVSAGTSISFTN